MRAFVRSKCPPLPSFGSKKLARVFNPERSIILEFVRIGLKMLDFRISDAASDGIPRPRATEIIASSVRAGTPACSSSVAAWFSTRTGEPTVAASIIRPFIECVFAFSPMIVVASSKTSLRMERTSLLDSMIFSPLASMLVKPASFITLLNLRRPPMTPIISAAIFSDV